MSRERVISYLLIPFFLLLLIFAQVVDIGRFLLWRFGDLWAGVHFHLSEIIDRLPLTLKSKYILMVTTGWTSTIMLTVILAVVVASWWWTESHIKTIAQPDGSQLTISEASPLLSPTPTTPPEIHFASDEAIVMVDEDELLQLIESTMALSPTQLDWLSQREKINLALAYYYLGSQQGYEYWLARAQAMDPNIPQLRQF